MKLTVFGATGGVGGEAVRQALAAGHEVTAVVRDPARLDARGTGLEVVRSALDSPDELVAAVAGRDAVLSGLGVANKAQARTGLAERLTRTVLAALAAAGTRRLVVVSAAPLAPPAPGTGLLDRAMLGAIDTLLKPVYEDLRAMERLLRESDTAWTPVRPPRLTNGPLTGTYRTAVDANPAKGRTISRADVAHAMLQAADDPSLAGHALGVAY
ncbi:MULTISPECIES: NAD(P)H-binding protein [unclassified Streptomyces]|uniref:NAD(P)-dependent oxidoreductase n=1 Tax=unclassified Streptomyces TaxID=2593676 RepID=UPI00081D881A|nr:MULTISPECIES: NAD(P)H-binding protein [unclassified Streptomyces]MYR28919.1 NAD(P)H-binding protein [Streptomyces sp. SID4945]SCF42420.1 Putative NADH-flavin reductase [Streptomyces sp. LcepLS]